MSMYGLRQTPSQPAQRKDLKMGGSECCISKGAHEFYPDQCMVKSESKWLESEKRRSNKGEHNVTNGRRDEHVKAHCERYG